MSAMHHRSPQTVFIVLKAKVRLSTERANFSIKNHPLHIFWPIAATAHHSLTLGIFANFASSAFPILWKARLHSLIHSAMHWTDYRHTNPLRLALELASRHIPDAAAIVRQVEGWQRLRMKVPSWAAMNDLLYPPRLSLEQCSGETAARLKAAIVTRLQAEGLVGRRRMTDLTGGLGIDFSFLAPQFAHATYVERQEELCRLARHNFPLLGLEGAEVVCDEAEAYLNKAEAADLIYLDPARRDDHGGKTVHIADCQPDMGNLMSRLLEVAPVVAAKLSPMLDVREALRTLGTSVAEVHAVGAGGECKELLLIMTRQGAASPTLTAHEAEEELSFTLEEEQSAAPPYASVPGRYLYEPGAAVMKLGAFRTVALRYGLEKLHPDAHLYTEDKLVPTFPGRTLRVIETLTFGKADLRRLKELTGGRANLTVRGFPATTEAVRRKLKLRDGGASYVFATTLSDGSHALILSEKVTE